MRGGLDRAQGARGELDPFSHTDNLYAPRLAGGLRDTGLWCDCAVVEPLELSYYSDDDDPSELYNEVDVPQSRWSGAGE